MDVSAVTVARRPHRRHAVIVATITVLAALAMASVVDSRRSSAMSGMVGPVKVSVTTASGQTLAVHAEATGGVQLFEIRAHICRHGASISNTVDFGYQGSACVAEGGIKEGGLSGDYETFAAPANRVSGDLAFRAGTGTVGWLDEVGYPHTLTCGPGAVCDLVVQLQITNGTVFYAAPVCFGGACPAEPDAPVVAAGAGAPATTAGAAAAPPSTASGPPEPAASAGTPKAVGAEQAARRGGLDPVGSGARLVGAHGVPRDGREGRVDRMAGVRSRDRRSSGRCADRVHHHSGSATDGRRSHTGIRGAAPGPLMRAAFGRVACSFAALGVAAALGACGGSGDSGASAQSSDTTTAAPGSAEITSLIVPRSVSCPAGTTSVPATVSYTATGAESLQIILDGLEIDGARPPSGALEVRVHCDAVPHTVVLIAKDDAGRPTAEQRLLTTELQSG